MLVMNLLIPATMAGFGRAFLKKAPGKINYAFGYRTSMSMKNKDTWDYAHKFCRGELWGNYLLYSDDPFGWEYYSNGNCAEEAF